MLQNLLEDYYNVRLKDTHQHKEILAVAQSSNYKKILNDEVLEFRIYYQKEVDKYAPAFIQNVINAYFKDDVKSFKRMSDEGREYLLNTSINNLNEEIFNKHIEPIRMMINVAVHEL